MDDILNLNADTIPPRHVIESDDEDELNPIHNKDTNTLNTSQLDIKILGDIPQENSLIIASGDAGSFWATGATLGEQTAAISVNGVQVGLVFHPFWTKSTIIISEALSRLPSWAMHIYAQTIIDNLKPTNVSLLDVYAIPAYITQNPLSIFDSPIRFLSTSSSSTLLKEIETETPEILQPFSPPNLINTTSSSFLSILTISQTLTSLFLLPSQNILKPPPQSIEPSNIAHLTQDVTEWPSQIMNQAHELLFKTINDDTKQQWELQSSSSKHKSSSARQVGDGGMYI